MARYGALGATLQIARIVQTCSLIAIIGLTANFIAEIVSRKVTPPGILIGTIVVTCIAAIYCLITFILFLDDILPFLASAAMDTLVLAGIVVVAVILGTPLSYLRCDIMDVTASATLDYYLQQLDYSKWIVASRGVCLEAKSIWGLSIALCILFFFSAICCGCLWWQKKKTLGKKLEG